MTRGRVGAPNTVRDAPRCAWAPSAGDSARGARTTPRRASRRPPSSSCGELHPRSGRSPDQRVQFPPTTPSTSGRRSRPRCLVEAGGRSEANESSRQLPSEPVVFESDRREPSRGIQTGYRRESRTRVGPRGTRTSREHPPRVPQPRRAGAVRGAKSSLAQGSKSIGHGASMRQSSRNWIGAGGGLTRSTVTRATSRSRCRSSTR